MNNYRERKKILFLIGSLDSGGVSKSMVSLLNTIDRQKYEVSLWVGSPSGIFYDLLPQDIRLLSDERISLLLKGTSGLLSLLKQGYFFLFLGNLFRLFLACFNKGYAGWILSKLMPVIVNIEYDMIVDYNGQHQLYYMVDKLKGKKKVTFFHSDYSKWPYYYQVDKKYYSRVSYIYSISDVCVDSLKKYFPSQINKIGLIENISSPILINKLSELPIDDFEGNIKLLTLGHICKSKGLDLAIKSAAILKRKGLCFKWFFLGKEIENFHDLIEKLDLTNEIIYLGMRTNPYPYLKLADLYIHPSRFEGKSIALDEAKILCKPIVVTNFSTVRDQFENRVNASICEMTPESLSDAIIELLVNEKLRIKYQTYLSDHLVDNSNEIDKLYKIIED